MLCGWLLVWDWVFELCCVVWWLRVRVIESVVCECVSVGDVVWLLV
jgi:hypothetical protein